MFVRLRAYNKAIPVLLVLVTSCLATEPTGGSPANASAPSTVSADQARQCVDMLWPNAPNLFRETEVKRITGSNQTADKLLRLAKPAQTGGPVIATYNPADVTCKQGEHYGTQKEHYGEYEHQNHNKGVPDVDYQEPGYDQYSDKGPYRGYLTRFWAKDGRYAGEQEKTHDHGPYSQTGNYPDAVQPSVATYEKSERAIIGLNYKGNPTDSGVIDYSFPNAFAFYVAEIFAAGPISPASPTLQLLAKRQLPLVPAEGRPYMVINGRASYPTRVTIWAKLDDVLPGTPQAVAAAESRASGNAPTNTVSFGITPRLCQYNGPCGSLDGTITVSSPFPESITPLAFLDRCWWEGRVVRAECVITPGQTGTC